VSAGVPQVNLLPSLLGRAGPVAGERGLGSLDRVDRVGLALETSGLAVGTVDLDHVDLLITQQPGQSGSVDAGALTPDPRQLSESSHPGKQGGTHQPGNADKTVMGPLARLL
jgi:hypothetical protein